MKPVISRLSIVSVSVCALLSGCIHVQSPDIKPALQVSSTTYQGAGHEVRGTVFVQAIDKTQQNSLEFKAVSAYVTQKLEANGYVASNEKNARFKVFITYGIDNGETKNEILPIFGQTGGGATYSSGTVTTNANATGYSSGTVTGSRGNSVNYSGTGSARGSAVTNYSGTTWSMPTYGMVGALPMQFTLYKRAVNIDIFKVAPKKEAEKVYELRAVSKGTCGNVKSVIFPIIDGMFMNFPGVNGVTKKSSVDWDGEC